MDKQVKDGEAMVATINGIRPIAQARLWTAKDNAGNVTKVRVYLDKGYIDLRANDTACMETVGRSSFTAGLAALDATGYKRVYA